MASTTAQNFEQVTYGAPGLAQMRSAAKAIIGDAVATRTLTAKESGATILLDAATVTYRLPTPSIGMFFEFRTTVAATAGKVVTGLATEFLLGALSIQTIATVTPAGFAANGTTIRSVNTNGTTTGGLVGDKFTVTAISSTQWLVEGILIGSGTLATPFLTS